MPGHQQRSKGAWVWRASDQPQNQRDAAGGNDSSGPRQNQISPNYLPTIQRPLEYHPDFVHGQPNPAMWNGQIPSFNYHHTHFNQSASQLHQLQSQWNHILPAPQTYPQYGYQNSQIHYPQNHHQQNHIPHHSNFSSFSPISQSPANYHTQNQQHYPIQTPGISTAINHGRMHNQGPSLITPISPGVGHNERSRQSVDSVLDKWAKVDLPGQDHTWRAPPNQDTPTVLPSLNHPTWNSVANSTNLAPNFSFRTNGPSTRKATPAPNPTAEYLARSAQPPSQSSHPRRLLVILDLNGTVLCRKPSGGTNFTSRPGCAKFLSYILENHYLMIWSSARPKNVDTICKKLFFKEHFAELVAIWARDKCGLSPQDYWRKVQVYKKLSLVWADEIVQARLKEDREVWKGEALSGDGDIEGREVVWENEEMWDQGNTVLIDDSVEKARTEPHNLILIPEFVVEGAKVDHGDDTLSQVKCYLEGLRWDEDVSRAIRCRPFAVNVRGEA